MSAQLETIVVEGLAARARIEIDRWGIPHITTETKQIFSSFKASTPRGTAFGRSTCGASVV